MTADDLETQGARASVSMQGNDLTYAHDVSLMLA